MSLDQRNRTVVIKRGKLSPNANDGEQAAPGSGATITIYDSTANWNNIGNSRSPGVPFSRLQLNIYSSHDSAANGVVFQSAFGDGTNFRNQSTQTYTNASGPTTYDYLQKGDQTKITYQNSANTLSAWEYTLLGIIGDRNPGS
jgi:hypothetical protein